MFVAILAIILTLILVVGIHEAGHAVVARFFQVKIKKISIGFGRPLLSWRSKSGIDWVWAIWPLGGYVQLLNSRITHVDPKEYADCFDKKPIWIRILILLAGALANIITTWVAFVLVFYIGIHYKLPQIQSVQPNSLAAQAGVFPGDQFIAISGQLTPSWQEVGMELVILWGKKDVKVTFRSAREITSVFCAKPNISLTSSELKKAQVYRGPLSIFSDLNSSRWCSDLMQKAEVISGTILSQANKTELKEITLDLSQINFTGREKSLLAGLGITPNLSAPSGVMRSDSILGAMFQANAAITHMFYFFMMILKLLFTGLIPFTMLLGPIGLFAASIASLMQGVVVFIFFIASFSLAVAVVNLFPLPGLDGGSILYCIIEKIRKKPLSVAFEVLLYQLMFILFCLLLVHLVNNDLARFFIHKNSG